MRPVIALLSLPLLVVAAHAEKKGGGGGGALSGVSAGIGRASGSASPQPGGSVDRTDTDARLAELCYDGNGRLVDEHAVDECYYPRVHHDGNAVLVKRKARVEPPSPLARLSVYAGAQKVHDSDGSGTLDILVTDNRFLLHGTVSRYFERQAGTDPLTMTLPTLTAGVRIADGTTTVDFEGGVALVRTNNDRMGDSKLTGAIAGMRVEHALAGIALVGDVQQMWFDNEIRATGGRIGARYKYVEAGFRVLDFNVGPALYGPEVGVRF